MCLWFMINPMGWGFGGLILVLKPLEEIGIFKKKKKSLPFGLDPNKPRELEDRRKEGERWRATGS